MNKFSRSRAVRYDRVWLYLEYNKTIYPMYHTTWGVGPKILWWHCKSLIQKCQNRDRGSFSIIRNIFDCMPHCNWCIYKQIIITIYWIDPMRSPKNIVFRLESNNNCSFVVFVNGGIIFLYHQIDWTKRPFSFSFFRIKTRN